MKDIVIHHARQMGWLTCAVCNKPVDSIEQIDDPYMDRRVFRAHCHGQVDEATLDAITLMDSIDIKFTWAFQRQALEKKNEMPLLPE